MQANRQEKSQIKQNILLYLSKKGVSPYEFYKKTGVTRGILTQNNGINEDNLTRFLAYAPDVNLEWLLSSRGEMLKTKCKTNTGTLPEASPSTAPQGNDALCKGRKTLEEVQPSEEKNPYFEALIDRIVQMTEEICRLKSRIDQLEHRTE